MGEKDKGVCVTYQHRSSKPVTRAYHYETAATSASADGGLEEYPTTHCVTSQTVARISSKQLLLASGTAVPSSLESRQNQRWFTVGGAGLMSYCIDSREWY